MLFLYYSIFIDFIYIESIFNGFYILENCGSVDNSFVVYVFWEVYFFNGNFLWIYEYVLLIIKELRNIERSWVVSCYLLGKLVLRFVVNENILIW